MASLRESYHFGRLGFDTWAKSNEGIFGLIKEKTSRYIE